MATAHKLREGASRASRRRPTSRCRYGGTRPRLATPTATRMAASTPASPSCMAQCHVPPASTPSTTTRRRRTQARLRRLCAVPPYPSHTARRHSSATPTPTWTRSSRAARSPPLRAPGSTRKTKRWTPPSTWTTCSTTPRRRRRRKNRWSRSRRRKRERRSGRPTQAGRASRQVDVQGRRVPRRSMEDRQHRPDHRLESEHRHVLETDQDGVR